MFERLRKGPYDPLDDSELETSICDEEKVDDQTSCCEQYLSHRRQKWALNASCAVNIVLLALFTLLLFQRNWPVDCRPSSDPRYDDPVLNHDLKKTSAYSPIFDQIDLKPQMKRLNGRLHDNTTIWRLDPSPEVDQAWDTISAEKYEIITVSSAAISHSSKNPSLSVKAPTSWNRGTDAYPAQVDVFHQIHCLNELRKEMHFDYYYSDKFPVGPDGKRTIPVEHQEHKKHCLHMLLQNIMCHADVDVITHNWVHYEDIGQPDRPYAEPFADFNLQKQCRDFGGLLEWVKGNAVEDLERKWSGLEMPEGAQFVEGDGYF